MERPSPPLFVSSLHNNNSGSSSSSNVVVVANWTPNSSPARSRHLSSDNNKHSLPDQLASMKKSHQDNTTEGSYRRFYPISPRKMGEKAADLGSRMHPAVVSGSKLSSQTRERLNQMVSQQQQQQQQQQEQQHQLGNRSTKQSGGRRNKRLSEKSAYGGCRDEYSSIKAGSETTGGGGGGGYQHSHSHQRGGYNSVWNKSSNKQQSDSTAKGTNHSGSLDSLDSVTSSIQQARANSIATKNSNNNSNNNSSHYGSAGRILLGDNPAYSRALSSSSSTSAAFAHFPEVSKNLYHHHHHHRHFHHPSSASPSSSSSNPFVFSDQHQRTFPLRKSSSRNSGSDFDAGDSGTVPRRMPVAMDNSMPRSEVPTSEGLFRREVLIGGTSKSHEDILEGSGRNRLLWANFGEADSHDSKVTSQPDSASKTTTAGTNNMSSGRHKKNANNSGIKQESMEDVSRLRGQLREEQDKVLRLNNQLSTNAHVVSAFEHSLANLTERLTRLTDETEKKDKELLDMRKVIRELKSSEASYAFTSGYRSFTSVHNVPDECNGHQMILKSSPPSIQAPSRWRSHENVVVCASGHNKDRVRNCSGESEENTGGGESSGFRRRRKSATWLRSSFNKAFRRRSSSQQNGRPSTEQQSSSSGSASNLLDGGGGGGGGRDIRDFGHKSVSISALDDSAMRELRLQLSAKDELLTETRLEALAAAEQAQTLRETVAKLTSELKSAQRENEELRQKLTNEEEEKGNKVASKIIRTNGGERESFLNNDDSRGPTSLSVTISDNKSLNGKLKTFRIMLRPPLTSTNNRHSMQIGILSICPSSVKPRQTIRACTRLLALYLGRLDPAGILGLDAKKVQGVIVGEETLSIDQDYATVQARRAIEEYSDLSLDVQDGGEMFCSISALHPLSEVKRHLEILKKQKILVMAGPKGTGKKHYATSLLEALFPQENILRIDCRRRTLQEIEVKMKHNKGVILDNSTPEVIKHFQAYGSKVVIIAILKDYNNINKSDLTVDVDMSVCQACGVTLPLSLRRRAIAAELTSGLSNDDMLQALSWLGQLLGHLSSNHLKIISTEVGLDRLQRDCPAEGTTKQFRQWFLRWWSGELVGAFRDCASLDEDPREYVLRTWPWRDQGVREGLKPLLPPRNNRIPLGEERTKPEGAEDPLMSMLLCLQKAAVDSNNDAAGEPASLPY